MSNAGNLLLTIGFVFIIVFGSVNYYTSLNVATNNQDFLNLSGLSNYDEYNELYNTEHSNINDPDSDFQQSSLGDLIFGQGYTSLKNIFSGNWLVLSTNIIVTSLGFAPIDPVIIGILITLVGLTFLLVMLGAVMNRYLIGR